MANRSTILITTPYFHPVVGGLENYAYALSTGLAETGFKVIIATGDPKVKKVTVEKHDGLKIYRMPVWLVISNTPINPLWYFMIRRIIKTEKPAIINAHTPVPFMADIAALAAGDKPFVVTYHAATLFKKSSVLMRLITALYLPVQNLTFKKARSIFAASDYVKTSLPSRIQPKTFVMPNATYITAPRRQAGQGLVFVGNLDHSHAWKGLELILESLALIKEQIGSAPHLTVIGDGTARVHYEEVATKLDLTDTVTFTGVLIGKARDHRMSKAAALISYPTTANDAFPTVFLEAWSLGLAVISCRIGPIESAVDEDVNALLAEPNDPADLAATLQKAFEHTSSLRTLGRNGKRLVSKTYNWPTQVARAANVLEQLT